MMGRECTLKRSTVALHPDLQSVNCVCATSDSDEQPFDKVCRSQCVRLTLISSNATNSIRLLSAKRPKPVSTCTPVLRLSSVHKLIHFGCKIINNAYMIGINTIKDMG